MTRLRALFLIDAKRRLINNTPWDVYMLLSHINSSGLECVDLRFVHDERALPPAECAFLVLETAGTWMCFDWDESRFRTRIEQLAARYPRLVVIGPQAHALRDLLDVPFEPVSVLAFEAAIASDFRYDTAVDLRWLSRPVNECYNGEFLEHGRLILRPTVSIYHSMSCPMGCSFCFYATSGVHKRTPFPRVAHSLVRLCELGMSHVYFMDPNFLLSDDDWQQLRTLKRDHPDFTYYCQISPNLLTPRTVARLAESGCCGMVVGIENSALIHFKGSIDRAHRAVDRVRAAGMMPMLYFLIDGRTELLPLVQEFNGVPFRHSILNNAFAGDRSLVSIRAGFAEKDRIRERSRELIAALCTSPDHLTHLGSTTASPQVG